MYIRQSEASDVIIAVLKVMLPNWSLISITIVMFKSALMSYTGTGRGVENRTKPAGGPKFFD
jgi:hypothetical protein